MRNPKLKMGDFGSRPGGVLALSRGGVQRQRQGGNALPRVLDIWKIKCINLPCRNSNSLLTTVFKNFQWARRNLGYWPTTYIMLEAIIALLSFSFFCSHRPRRSFITVTRNLFPSSSCIAPDIEPIAQHSYNTKLGSTYWPQTAESQ